MPACMLLELHHPHLHDQGHQSSATQAWALGCSLPFLSDSCKSSLTECIIVAKLLRSVNSLLLTWDISSASHFPLEVKAQCKSHLGPSEHHRWTKMGLLIYSKSHNQNAQRELDKNSGPGYCLSHKVLSCSVQKSATFLLALVS